MVFKSWLRELMGRRKLKLMVTRMKQSPLSIIGASIVIFYIIIALLAPLLAPPGHPSQGGDPFQMPRYGFAIVPKPPSPEHPFGTAQGQFDIYYGCIWGTVAAFRMGFLVVFGVLAIGFVIGAVAGYFGGIIDELVMKLTDIILALSLILVITLVIALPPIWVVDLGFLSLALSFPIVIVIIAHFGFKFSGPWSMVSGLFSFVYILLFLSVFKLSLYPLNLALTSLDKVLLSLVIVGWPIYARIVRGEIVRMKHEDFARAAEAVGFSNIGVKVKHPVPELAYPILIIPFLGIGPIVLIAAILSFLGIGVPYGYADWGQLISFSRNYIWAGAIDPWKYWYTYVIPGLFLFTFVLGWILLSDAFRDVLTRLRESNWKEEIIQERKSM
jgi:peptide/nickel transport system permease protein